jgi:hypothetical protein
MTIEELIAEGETLARPCFLMSSSRSSRLAGYWGGERADKPNRVPAGAKRLASRRHIVTIDEGLLAELGLPATAPLSLFETTDIEGRQFHHAERERAPLFAAITCTGEPLYATPARSFPPLAAVCLYGSSAVEAWMKERGLARHDYGALGGDPLGRAYMREFVRRSPFYSSDDDAIVGGWHMMWPDDNFFMPMEMRLVLTTKREAEPYFEIWVAAGSGNVSVRRRIT